MKTIILPAIWYMSAVGMAFAVFVFGRYVGLNSFVALGLAWFCSIAAALIAGGVAVWMKPDLRFSTRQQTDGLGYVHQPFGVIVNITVIAGVALVTQFFKR